MEVWKKALDRTDVEKGQHKVIVALNNNDTEKVLIELLRINPEKVFAGIKMAATVMETKNVVLYIPTELQELFDEIEEIASVNGVEIEKSDFVDLRTHDTSVVHHIETMLVLAELVSEGIAPGTYLSLYVDHKMGPLKRVEFGTKIADALGIDGNDFKGIEIGNRLFDASGKDLMITPELPLGNGVVHILDRDACIIDETEKRLFATRRLSCGQCTFCREGVLQLDIMTKEITKGKAKADQLPLMQEIGEAIGVSTLCSVGHYGATFLLDSMKVFHSEYEDHIKKKLCSAGKCNAFLPLYIDPEACTGCEECMDVCPVDCIEGKSGYIHMIDHLDCTKCGKCIEVCESEAIKTAKGKLPKLPDRLTKCGRFRKFG